MSKVTSSKGELTVPDKALSLQSPQELVNFAMTLKTVIVDQQLWTDIKGKKHVNVEGWQFAGAVTGLTELVESVERIEIIGEIRYRATINLVRIDNPDVIVGRGVAICSSKEGGRGNADEYVIMSMAQTRAIGKAYRNKFGWLMKLAGYEATPSEEVTEEIVVNQDDQLDIDQLDPAEVKEYVLTTLDGMGSVEKIKVMKSINKLNPSQIEPQEYPRLYRLLKSIEQGNES